MIMMTSAATLAAFLITGCAKHPMDPQMTMKPPVYVEQMASKEQEPVIGNAGSLFGQGESPLFSDRKAMRVNDIVRVIIRESATASSSGQRSLTKSDKVALETGFLNRTPAQGGTAAPAIGLGSFGFSNTSTSAFTGQGTNKRNERFETTISARIVKVMANNTYFIEGSRELLIDGQKQIVQISGVIRADDIDQYNKIDSTYIADAKIFYKTEGDIQRVADQGWLSKFLSGVWPF
ncbi:MAG: flagellar basal body L-ring protein FlgH [Campylobacterales bacterium]